LLDAGSSNGVDKDRVWTTDLAEIQSQESFPGFSKESKRIIAKFLEKDVKRKDGRTLNSAPVLGNKLSMVPGMGTDHKYVFLGN
jgi:hypothetical protein